MFVNEKPNQYISVIMAFFFTQFNKVIANAECLGQCIYSTSYLWNLVYLFMSVRRICAHLCIACQDSTHSNVVKISSQLFVSTIKMYLSENLMHIN